MHRRVIATLACVAALPAIWALAFRSTVGDRIDETVLHGFVDLRGHHVFTVSRALSSMADPVPFILLGSALILLALARGRRRLAMAIPPILIAANATTQILKPALAEARDAHFLGLSGQITPASWPSGHATAAMALGLCAVLVAPPARRRLAVLGAGLYVAGVSCAVLILGWHYPSDVLSGYAVAAGWTLAGVSVLAALRGRRGREARAVSGRKLAAAWSPSGSARGPTTTPRRR